MVMKKYLVVLLVCFVALFSACEKEIFVEVDPGVQQLTIDAFINNKNEKQVIKLNRSREFFNRILPPAVTSAVVTIKDDLNNEYSFTHESNGNYVWIPSNDTLIKVGRTYTLLVELDGINYSAKSVANRVARADSINYQKVPGNFGQDSSYITELVAIDVPGAFDYYWIKTYINDTLRAGISDLVISVDGSFSEQGNNDGFPFIVPISGVFGLNENDKIKREIYSIDRGTFRFFTEIQNQQVVGPLGALFATPLANVRSNITSDATELENQAVGWFSVSVVSSASTTLLFNPSRRVSFGGAL